MKYILALLIALALFSAPAHALTGKVLIIVADKLEVGVDDVNPTIANIVFRCQSVQGWQYESCSSSDTLFLGSLYADNPTIAGAQVGSRYGRYDMAVYLNTPASAWCDTDAECVTRKMPHFCQMIDRVATWAFPIPLFIPTFNVMGVANKWAPAYTGATAAATAYAASVGYPFKDAQGDSMYILSSAGYQATLVATADSTDFSFVHPLFYRYTAGREAVKTRYAHAWITVGTGSHRVIWMPQAGENNVSALFPIIFAMFTKCTPIEIPVIANGSGYTNITGIETGADTLGLGTGLKAVVDYAIAEGMKVELACHPYRMHAQGITAHDDMFPAYATAHPSNIRLTMDAYQSWYPTGYSSMLGDVTTGSYSQKVNRIKYTQDSSGVYYPIINDGYINAPAGIFSNATTNDKADSTLLAIANRGVSDVATLRYPGSSAAYPVGTTIQLLPAQRTWINDGDGTSEVRFHPQSYLARYTIQVSNHADSLKKSYIDFAPEMLARATFASRFTPYMLGMYDYIGGANVRVSAASNKVIMSKAAFATGIALHYLTFCGGDSSKVWPSGTGGATTHADQAAEIRPTRSIFLDVMKMLNAQKKMGDYIVATYGTTGQSPYVWAWLDEVKWDRRNGRQFPNSHVSME